MIKIENAETYGREAAIRGMRNPMNSWERSDSEYCVDIYSCEECLNDDKSSNCYCGYAIGKNDYELMMKLAKAGSEHAKYRRFITVTMDITAHHAFWAEFDTYKVGTVRNSCSKMHRIHVNKFTKDDFSHEGIDECGGRTETVFNEVLVELEILRILFNDTHEKKYWRAIIELLPMGYNIRATVQFTYETLAAMYRQRKNHKLDEWRDFCDWCKENLPYPELFTLEEQR